MDISTLSIAQLRDLATRIPKEIEKRQKDEKITVRKELEALAAERGYSLDELISTATKGKKGAGGFTVAVKYRHPTNTTLTWTGRGRQPRWVLDFLSAGGTMDQLAA